MLPRQRMAQLALFFLLGGIPARVEPFFPMDIGATWQYEIDDPEAKDSTNATTGRVLGPEKPTGKELVRLETRRNDAIIKTETVAADDHGLFCYERTAADGKVASFNPPR